MEAPKSYLPSVSKDAEPKSSAADEEIVLFANNAQNSAPPASSWTYPQLDSAKANAKGTANAWQNPASPDAPGDAPKSDATTEPTVDQADDATPDADKALSDAFKSLAVATKNDKDVEIAFPNVHSAPDYRTNGRAYHHPYPDQHHLPADRVYKPADSDWPSSKVARKGNDDHYPRGPAPASPVVDYRAYNGAPGGAGAVGVMGHQYNGGAPGYLAPGTPYGQPPHVVPLGHYGHHQQGMYEMPYTPTDVNGPGGVRGPIPAYPRPGLHPSTSDPQQLALANQQQQQGQQPLGGPFSPMSPAPIHNPYVHHPHAHHPHAMQSFPQHNGSAVPGVPQNRVGGYPPMHQANGYVTDPYYNDVYGSPQQDPYRYPGAVGAANGSVNPVPPYGNAPHSPYPPHAMAPPQVQHQQGAPIPGAQPGPGPHAGGVNNAAPAGTAPSNNGIVPVPDGQNGPSANNRKLGLYKTELCRSWEEKGSCRYGPKCQFAHGEEEIRKVARHPKYKTEICRTFWVSGSCPYGKRCCFIHTELPAAGGAPGNPNAPANGAGSEGRAPGAGPVTSATPAAAPDATNGHTRSTSTGSDPTDQPSSMLARISAKHGNEPNGATTAENASAPYPFTQPTAPTAASGQASRIPSAASISSSTGRADYSHNRHHSTLSDGRADGTESPSFNGARPGHAHSASAHTLVTPTFGPGGGFSGRQQGAPIAANGGLSAPNPWHKRSASGGSVNEPLFNGFESR